jgi:hypothetical protein
MPKRSYGCRISTLRRPQSSTVFPAPMRSGAIVMRSTNSLIGTARSRGYRSARLWWSGIECTWNRDNSHQARLLNDWMLAAGIQGGTLFRKVSSAGKPWGDGVTEKLVWHVVKEFAARIGNDRLAPRDLRRTCARLCRAAGGELEQIQFLLGHVSVQTTERYLGCTQRIASAVNDNIGIEPA